MEELEGEDLGGEAEGGEGGAVAGGGHLVFVVFFFFGLVWLEREGGRERGLLSLAHGGMGSVCLLGCSVAFEGRRGGGGGEESLRGYILGS